MSPRYVSMVHLTLEPDSATFVGNDLTSLSLLPGTRYISTVGRCLRSREVN